MIDDAITLVGREHFYTLLGGIDAYLEKRARKRAAEERLMDTPGRDGWSDR